MPSTIVLLAVLTERVRQVSPGAYVSFARYEIVFIPRPGYVSLRHERVRTTKWTRSEGKRTAAPSDEGESARRAAPFYDVRQTPATRAQTEGRRASGSSAWQLVLRTAPSQQTPRRSGSGRNRDARYAAPLTATAALAFAAIIITRERRRGGRRRVGCSPSSPSSSSSSGVIIISAPA